MGCCTCSENEEDNDTLDDFIPSCPVLFFKKSTNGTSQIYTIKCSKLNVSVECYASTAIIKMEGEWLNRNNDDLNCIFALPTFGTVQSITIKNESQRIITTAILPNDDAQQLFNQKYYKNEKNENDSKRAGKEKDEKQFENLLLSNDIEAYNDYNRFEYVAGLFRMPCNNIKAGSLIKICCKYIETLDYYKKGYVVSLPLYFPKDCIIDNVEWEKVINVQCKIYSLSSNTNIDCWTHHITKKEDKKNGIITITNGSCKPFEENKESSSSETGRDFEVGYSVKSDKISAHCISAIDLDESHIDPSIECGILSLLITPPTTLHTTFGRAVFFLLDRSGSMVGHRFIEATGALNKALDRLRPSDMFNIAAFDHRQVYYQQSLVAANKEMVSNAKVWITTYVPERGGTTLNAPFVFALNHLEKSELLPFLVLITDGSVHNEREICEMIESYKNMRTRILTFGIGCLVNNSFLTKLASLSRGFSDTAVYSEYIYHKMNHLLRIINTPCLIDLEIALKIDYEYLIYGYIGRYERYNNQMITIHIKQLIVSFYQIDLENEIEKIYPFPIHDLYIGAPVIITARYKSNKYLPKNIVIHGFNPHGDEVMLNVKVKRRNDIPVESILIKQQIDIMTSNAWLVKSKKLEQRVIDFSINSNIPSIFTKTLIFETNQRLLDEEERKIDEYINSFHGDIVDINNKYQRMKISAKLRNNKKTVSNMAFNPYHIYLIYAYIAWFERYNVMTIPTDIKQLIVSFYPVQHKNIMNLNKITGKHQLYFWSMSNIGITDTMFCTLGVGLFGFGDVQGTLDDNIQIMA